MLAADAGIAIDVEPDVVELPVDVQVSPAVSSLRDLPDLPGVIFCFGEPRPISLAIEVDPVSDLENPFNSDPSAPPDSAIIDDLAAFDAAIVVERTSGPESSAAVRAMPVATTQVAFAQLAASFNGGSSSGGNGAAETLLNVGRRRARN